MTEPEKKEMRLKPRNERLTDKPLGFIAALLAHAVLIFGLVTVFQWKTEAETFYAELWAPEDLSGTGSLTAPAALPPEPEPETVTPTKADLEARVNREAEIRLEEEKKSEALEKAAEEKMKEERAAEEARKAEEEKKRLEKAEKRRQDQLRKAELARILGTANTNKNAQRVGRTTGDMRVTKPNYSGNNQARYIAKVISLLRSQIIYQVPAGLKSGEHLAVYTVHLLPDGTQLKPPTLEKSSGLPAFDAAVESAIRRVNPFPPADAGTVLPKTIQITFDPVDNSR